MEHGFTPTIMALLKGSFGDKAEQIFASSPLLQYLNIKTKSANSGSKSRGAFGNHYAIYVLVEDYLNKGFDKKGGYGRHEGARFSDLFQRQRELPFGSKLQNHALNHRMNEEFKRFFKTCEYIPIMREPTTNRYWINENLLRVKFGKESHNIAAVIIKIIDAYVGAKRDAFEGFIQACQKMQEMQKATPDTVQMFVADLLLPNVDARIFEIVSFGILKQYYGSKAIFWGWSVDDLTEAFLIPYKTGRTNANDGGIDFVMRPLGRFFQVTETTDVKKYFLDIDKIQHYPITFVVKSFAAVDAIKADIRQQAERVYSVQAVTDRYMDCIEEIINIRVLMDRFREVVKSGRLGAVIDEIVLQSKVEFNYEVDDE
jgi:hypothetical protein